MCCKMTSVEKVILSTIILFFYCSGNALGLRCYECIDYDGETRCRNNYTIEQDGRECGVNSLPTMLFKGHDKYRAILDLENYKGENDWKCYAGEVTSKIDNTKMFRRMCTKNNCDEEGENYIVKLKVYNCCKSNYCNSSTTISISLFSVAFLITIAMLFK